MLEMRGTVESCFEKLAEWSKTLQMGKIDILLNLNMDESLDKSGSIQALESSWEDLCDELEVSMENLISLSDVNYSKC
jgi:glycine cleavage system regulatory protein